MIDFVKLFQDYNIKFWIEGKNVSKGWVNITCPLCGDKSNTVDLIHKQENIIVGGAEHIIRFMFYRYYYINQNNKLLIF